MKNKKEIETITEGIEELFERWLIETYPDEISNQDDLINKSCDGFRREEFNELVKKSL